MNPIEHPTDSTLSAERLEERAQELSASLKKLSYLALHNERKAQLHTVFEESLFFAHQTGIFKASPALIEFVRFYSAQREEVLVVDHRNTPVKLEDPQGFIEQALEVYHAAANRYHASYQELRTLRKNEEFTQ